MAMNPSYLKEGEATKRLVETAIEGFCALQARQFAAPAPNRLWVADLTYVKMHSGWCMSRSSPASSRAASSAGRHRAHCEPTWRWMHWKWRSSAGAARISAHWSTIVTAAFQYLAIRYTERLEEVG